MKTEHAHFISGAVSFLALAAFALLCAAPARAQTGTAPQPTPNPNVEARNRAIADRDLRAREWNLRNLEAFARLSSTPNPEDERIRAEQQRMIVRQVNKDYRALHELNQEIAREALKVDQPDYPLIIKNAGEIHKRAGRLKQFLVLPELKEDEKRSQAAADGLTFKESLGLLDARIRSFTDNPFFKNNGAVDVEHSVRAGRDLRDIIEISHSIKKNADRLHKASAKSK